MGVYKVLHVLAESSAAGTCLGGKASLLSLLVLTIDGAAHGAGLIALVVEVAGLLVAAVEGGHLVFAIGELLQ